MPNQTPKQKNALPKATTGPKVSVGKPKHKKIAKTSIVVLRAGAVPKRVRPQRQVRSLVTPQMLAQLEALDKQIGVMDPGRDTADEDDTDYRQAIGGRPGQFSNTFTQTYGSATFQGGQFSIACAEPGCIRGGTILMTAKWVEVRNTTPPVPPRKPPVCHDVPWAALEVELAERERLAGKRFTDYFNKSVCWYQPNLRAGHAECNGMGVKTNAQTAPQFKKAAGAIIDTVMADFSTQNLPIWA
ncbi:hypothetical protein D621_08505 [beta proteobacterium AAP51]|nr:hypothetical protein D621_08505 [beta proteobacterium AAP51]